MRRSFFVFSVVCGLALVAQGCGGSGQEAKSADSAKAEQTAMDELKSIPKDLNTDVADLTKPIDDTQAIVDEFTSMPKRLGITADDMRAMAKATITNGTVEVKVSGNVTAEAKAEIEASLKKLQGVLAALKATPEKVATLTKKIVTVSAKVPVLATRVTSEATVKVGNPFASADVKASAKADLDSVKTVQASIDKSVSDTQAKVTGIPALATGALGKLTATFAGGK